MIPIVGFKFNISIIVTYYTTELKSISFFLLHCKRFTLSSFSLLANATTCTPFLANCTTIAAPIPALAPVTIATLPLHRSIVLLIICIILSIVLTSSIHFLQLESSVVNESVLVIQTFGGVAKDVITAFAMSFVLRILKSFVDASFMTLLTSANISEYSLKRLDSFATPALLIKILAPPSVESTHEKTSFTACSLVTSQTFCVFSSGERHDVHAVLRQLDRDCRSDASTSASNYRHLATPPFHH
ncbi:hypothetical protein AGLY_005273, partial [Aphis glycines]